MASDALPYFIDQLDQLPAGTINLDLLIVSLGGDPMVAWRIMSLIRQRVVDKVSVLIPQSAYSAATLLALGADEIVMHPNGHLGPIDMQITTITEGEHKEFSTQDIGAFLDFVKEDVCITDQRHLRRLFELMCKEMGTTGVGFSARSSRLAVALGERLLGFHMKGAVNYSKRKSLVDSLSKQFYSHGYPVSRSEAIDVDLPVNKGRDEKLESLMWRVWLDLEAELKERQPFNPVFELSSSPQGAKLFSAVPQLDFPPSLPSPSYFQASLAEVAAAVADPGTVKIDPVDFEHIHAVLESRRSATRSIERGKILACRLPDLNLQLNVIVTFRGWETKHP